MTLGRLNHIGVATPSIGRSVETYRTLMGATAIGDAVRYAGAGGAGVFHRRAQHADRADRAAHDAASPIAGFLAKKNPAGGQHHLCFEVADLAAADGRPQSQGRDVARRSRASARMGRRSFSSIRAIWEVMLVELMKTPASHV